jgi:hypothetical protein
MRKSEISSGEYTPRTMVNSFSQYSLSVDASD